MDNNTPSANKDDEFYLVDSTGAFKKIVISIRIENNFIIVGLNPTLKYTDFAIKIVDNWKKIQDELKNELEKQGITENIFLSDFYKTLNYNREKIIKNLVSRQDKKDEDIKDKNIIRTFKVTKNDTLYESAIIGDNVFFVCNNNGEIELIKEIEDENEAKEIKAIRPIDRDNYPYNPYTFSNKEEIQEFWNLIKQKQITLDTIYREIRKEIGKFIVHDDHVLNYLTALIIFSYFQDFFATVPYTMFVSDNGSGKSVIGNFFELLSYRPINMTDPTVANIFRIFGTLESGQCTLVLDEAEKIDTDNNMMSILKNGYENGKKVQRINQFGKQEHFHTFGLKLMAAERVPNTLIAKGVLDRTFVISNYKGKPQLDIKEIKNVKNERNVEIKEFFELVRKLLLLKRVERHNTSITDIETGLEGRNKELCKPMLQIFYKTEHQHEVEKVLEILINAKQNRKENSMEKSILEIILVLFNKYSDGNIPFNEIWNLVTKNINGEVNPLKGNEFETDNHGTIYKRTVSKILRDKFGATDSKKREAKVTYLYFEDKEKIERFLEDYQQTHITINCYEIQTESSESNIYNLDRLR
ncbi:MAG TPA: hypothetical protein VFV86_07390 [Nitrososphaeraceae archaeon]|nr:hypothetical protein [Nitrososphaeraceae archaeon]